MKNIINDFKIYKNYIFYSTKSKLKSEVSNSYLNALWWILNPLIYMLIYIFIVEIVFKRNEINFPVFVFIGLTIWNYCSRFLNSSVKTIIDNKTIINKTYLPKYILLIIKSFTLIFQMIISIILVFILMSIFKIHLSITSFLFPLILIVMYLFTFGIGLIFMHIGVYISDFKNIIELLLKFIFYFSGIFYSVEKALPNILSKLILYCNPFAFFIDSSRKVLMYNKIPNLYVLAIYLFSSIVIVLIGLKIVSKNENKYVKVII